MARLLNVGDLWTTKASGRIFKVIAISKHCYYSVWTVTGIHGKFTTSFGFENHKNPDARIIKIFNHSEIYNSIVLKK